MGIVSTPRVGERAYSTYIKHPAGSTSNPISNGWPIDSGTVELFDSNLSLLSYESVRPLVATLGPGSVSTQSSGDKFWTGFTDDVPTPARSWSGVYQDIPWDRRTSMRFGPFPLVADRWVLDGGATGSPTGAVSFRELAFKVVFTVAAANTAQVAFFVVTEDSSPASITNGAIIGSPVTYTLPGTGQQTFANTWRYDPPVLDSGVSETWVSRSGGASVSNVTQVTQCFVWVGWYFLNAGAVTNTVDSVCVWEIR